MKTSVPRALRAVRFRARDGSATHRLTTAAPAAELMLKRAAERGQNLGALVSRLLTFLDMYGPTALDQALVEVNQTERVGPKPVRLALLQKARQQGRTEPMPVHIQNDALRELTVTPADLSSYDQLHEENGDDKNP